MRDHEILSHYYRYGAAGLSDYDFNRLPGLLDGEVKVAEREQRKSEARVREMTPAFEAAKRSYDAYVCDGESQGYVAEAESGRKQLNAIYEAAGFGGGNADYVADAEGMEARVVPMLAAHLAYTKLGRWQRLWLAIRGLFARKAAP